MTAYDRGDELTTATRRLGADLEHADLSSRRAAAAGPDGGGGGALHWRRGCGARLSEPAGSDGGAVFAGPVRRAGARLYRTGDLARYLADGDIEFLGRIDHQVKIRGFRIELGEIEAALAAHAGVREAAVLAREDQPGDKRLVAYVAGREGTTPAAGELRAALQAHLPDYMLPSAFVTLDALPLTANGKVDRKALPAPDLGALQAHRYVAPRTATEAALCRIWAQTLGLERVGVEDNFFELGGHSLLAVTLIERMRQEGLQADVRALFVSPTPAALAAEAGRRAEVLVPPNLIAQGCAAITPEMLPLAQLSQARHRSRRRQGSGRGVQRAGHLPADAAAGRHIVPPSDGRQRRPLSAVDAAGV